MAVPAGGPLQDPAYLAFLRASGFDDEHLKKETMAQQAEIEAKKTLRRQGFAQQLMASRGEVQDSFQDRGLYSSGARMQTDTRAIANVGQQQAEYEQGLNQQGAGLSRDLEYGLAKSAGQRGDEALTAADRVARRNADYQAAF